MAIFSNIHYKFVLEQGALEIHYENTPIQIYRRFHLQKLKKIR